MSRQIAVVGGSVAGLYAAGSLAESGMRARVFEAGPERAPRPRSLIVTHALREMLGPLAEPAIVNEIRRFELYADGRTAVVPLEQPDLIIERSVLLTTLARRALNAGTELLYERHLQKLTADDAGARLEFTNGAGAERADVVIGADGAFSTVARCAGWSRPALVPLVQAIVRPPVDLRLDTTRVWFVPDDTPYFYWLIPESESRGALGIIGCDGKQARRCLDAFADAQGLPVLEYQAARIPEYGGWMRPHRRLRGADVYLVGDAAAQVKVTTVGGIVDGLWGATGVVEAVQGSAAAARTLRSLRVELGLHLLIRRALHHFREPDYIHLLETLDGAATSSLGRYNRDQTLRLLWSLVRGRPRFLLLGFRGLLTGRLTTRG